MKPKSDGSLEKLAEKAAGIIWTWNKIPYTEIKRIILSALSEADYETRARLAESLGWKAYPDNPNGSPYTGPCGTAPGSNHSLQDLQKLPETLELIAMVSEATAALEEKVMQANQMRGEALLALGVMQNERDAAERHLSREDRISDSEMMALLRRVNKQMESEIAELRATPESANVTTPTPVLQVSQTEEPAILAAPNPLVSIIQSIRQFDCGAWLDLQGFTDKGKQKCIELMHLLDKLYMASGTKGVEKVGDKQPRTMAAKKSKRISDEDVQAWADRHDIQGSMMYLRTAFEDAQTLHLL